MKRCRLLIVDDEERIIAALKRALRREGFEILTAGSAQEALHLLSKSAVDIILSDHKMPGMDGVELLAAARERRPSAIRLLITGWTEAVPPDLLESIGVAALIPKPWDDADLKDTLRSLRTQFANA